MQHAVVVVLLVAAAAVQVLSAIGLLVVRDPYDRVHYTSPAAASGLLVAAAIAVRLGPSIATEKAILLAVFLVLSSPVAAQVLARATRIRERGELSVREEERP